MNKITAPKSIKKSLIERMGVAWNEQVHAISTAESPGDALKYFEAAYKKVGTALVERGFDYNVVKAVINSLYVKLEKIAYGDGVVPGPEEVFEPAYR